MARSNPFRRVLKRFTTANQDLPESDSQSAVLAVTSIAKLQDREIARIQGVVDALNLKHYDGTPWLEAEITDGSGAATLIWMGRSEIPGIKVGRKLKLQGRFSLTDGKCRLYNPRYELVAS